MTSFFGSVTIGANPVQITNPLANNGKCAKLFVQMAPGNTGSAKVGRIPNLGTSTGTPGVYLASTSQTNPDASAQPGGSWVIESYSDENNINPLDYYFHGTHAGDILMWEMTVAG